MANHERIVLACIVGLAGCDAALLAHGQDERDGQSRAEVAVTVRIYNSAGVPEDVLQYAKAYAAQVFGRIHVKIAWLDRPVFENAPPQYAVVLMTPQAADRKAQEDDITDEVVGQAVVTARRAYLYYDRIAAMALPPERDLVTFLGYVMAHELGHLMLPPPSHASAGVMRAGFGLSSRVVVTFIEQQAAAIRQRLRDDARATDNQAAGGKQRR